ncbi:hypothetical protein SEUCBS140593_004398 [Sporothrix eucalyptigena]|uniref:Zn(2)-C6 fungal-type domain-containing protein n=1 Tax=Sporothrix eucalyptigena TaxID=1812306 RepID=A0ABP0BN88_9PEZI
MSTTVGETKTAKYPTKLRRNYPRSRNGCLTCRQRKKKCDETRPQCVGCARNKLSCVWPVRTKTATGSSSGDAPGTGAGSNHGLSGTHPCPLMTSSNLTLYQHKSKWQTYLPSLAAWEGVEGCSVNLSPAYDEAGWRRDVVASGIATAGTPAASNTNNTATDDTDSVQPQSSSQTDLDDCTTATTTTADEDDDGYDFDMAEDMARNEYDLHLDGDDEDNNDGDEDEDAILAVWSPAIASFVADTAPPPPPKPMTSAAAYNRARRRRQQQQQQQQQHHQNQNQRQQRPASASRPAYPLQQRRVAAMTPLSSSMLRHYIVEAAPTLATSRAARNPYIAAFLPLAYTDDLVMHCVLAIGGAHLSNRLTRPYATSGQSASSGPAWASSGSAGAPPVTANAAGGTTLTPYTAPDMAATALNEATTRHYTCVLRSLRSALRDLQPTNGPQVLRVLAVLLLLSTYECLSWNILGGGVFTHLRASRQLISWLRAEGGKAHLSADERSMFGALMEIYAYQVLANRICPDGSMHGRSAASEDPAAAHDDEDFVADPSLLQDQDCFGLLFSGLHGLFALIPPVSRLAAVAVKPRSTPNTFASSNSCLPPSSLSSLFGDAAGNTSSLTIAAQVATLRNRALAWQLPASFLAQATGDQERIWQRAIGEVYRHGVLIYLETIKTPDAEDDPSMAASGASAAAFQRHIHAIGEAVLGADLVASRFATILLWPLVIAGSILVHPDERTFLAEGLRASPQATWSSIRAADVLQQLWARRDSVVLSRALASSADETAGKSLGRQYYGPHGLAQVMRETSVNLCVG